MVSIDSALAGSMNAQVLTTITSAVLGDDASWSPSEASIPASLAESTSFFGQPSVSIQ